MRLSLQVRYAICGIFDLAYNGQGQPIQVRVIGERQGIPVRYLEQIFQRLRRAGLVSGKRGPGGGYGLVRSPRDISLLSVVEAVEGPIESSELGGSGTDGSGDPAYPYRPEFLWVELARGFSSVLAETTLEDVCREAAREVVRHSAAKVHTDQT
jgi:Rrf2 family protein